MRWLSLFLLLIPFSASAAGVVIDEILFDPSGTDTGLEWIEIVNQGDTPVDVSDWQLYPDGVGYFLFPKGFAVAPKNFVLVRFRVSGTGTEKELHHGETTGNMGNTSGSAALFSGEPRGKDTMKSFVQWGRAGETWESAAAEAGIWQKGTFVDLANFSEGNTIALTSGSGFHAADWVVSSSTPLYENGVSTNAPASSPVPPAASPAPSSASHVSSGTVPPDPQIGAYAGEDRMVAVGSLAEFTGRAYGLKREPLENARFWWNFGDGGAKEGRLASHVFEVPGKYVVGLHVSSGSFAASDYLAVTVVPNQVEVVDVLLGETGFLRLKNPSVYDLDIGGWIMEDTDETRFIIPPKTLIGKGAEAAFSNSLTGLLVHATGTAVKIYYSSGILALDWKEQASTPITRQSGGTPAAFHGGGVRDEKVSHNKNRIAAVPPRELPEHVLPEKQVLLSPDDEKSEYASAVVPASGSGFFILAIFGSFVSAVAFFLIRRVQRFRSSP